MTPTPEQQRAVENFVEDELLYPLDTEEVIRAALWGIAYQKKQMNTHLKKAWDAGMRAEYFKNTPLAKWVEFDDWYNKNYPQ